MSEIRRYIDRIVDSSWFIKTLFGTLIGLSVLGGGIQTYLSVKASNPNPPIYRDVNGDGEEDKIIQKKVRRHDGIFGSSYNTLEEETLYGVKVNGKKLYLHKDQFEEER